MFVHLSVSSGDLLYSYQIDSHPFGKTITYSTVTTQSVETDCADANTTAHRSNSVNKNMTAPKSRSDCS